MLPVERLTGSFHPAVVLRVGLATASPVSATQKAEPSALIARSRGSRAPPAGLPVYWIGLPVRWQVPLSRVSCSFPLLARLTTAYPSAVATSPVSPYGVESTVQIGCPGTALGTGMLGAALGSAYAAVTGTANNPSTAITANAKRRIEPVSQSVAVRGRTDL